MKLKTQTIKDNIKLLSESQPEVRDNYNLLVLRYWQKFEGVENLLDIVDRTPSESITRAFRSLVRGGHIKVSTETRLIRRRQQKAFIKEYEKEKV